MIRKTKFVGFQLDVEYVANQVANLDDKGIAEFLDELVLMLTEEELRNAITSIHPRTFETLKKNFVKEDL